MIDLRSDTVTKPTPAMLDAMTRAPLGDDVFDEDPTVHQLQDRVASLLGKEAALFVPSGTMSNQICVKVHTQPGDEVLCESSCHIYTYEAGMPAILGGVTCRTIDGDFGVLQAKQLSLRPDNEHFARTRLVCLENTHNRGGGRVYPLDTIQSISAWARQHHLAMHLDGARLWNAVVASGTPARTWCEPFDTVSVCFSKGLGAPIGSALAGPRDFVREARRWRKRLGGGMRQAGLLAAAALYALDHHIDRLADDHRNAQTLAKAIAATPGLSLVPAKVETNLVWFDLDPSRGDAPTLARNLKELGILVHPAGPQTLRACTHLDVSGDDVAKTCEALRKVVGVVYASRGEQ